MLVYLDTAPIHNGHASRGIGTYTRWLWYGLQKIKDLEIITTKQQLVGNKPDLYHWPTFDLFQPTLPWWAKGKQIVTIHDVIPLLFPHAYLVGIKGKIAFWRQKLALKKVDAVITDSNASARDINVYLKVPTEKIHVVPLACQPQLAPLAKHRRKEWRQKLRLPEKYILYVGDINYNKNLPQLIKAMKYLPENIYLVLLGKNFYPQSIPEWQAIETQVALSNVADRVIFLTNILVDDIQGLAAIYSLAECYVQPSLSEGFGLPILEAMTCNTPVVCTEQGSLPEVAGKHAVFAQPNAESLAAAIDDVLSWSKSKKQTAVESAARWAGKFTWEKTAKLTYKVYQQVVKQTK